MSLLRAILLLACITSVQAETTREVALPEDLAVFYAAFTQAARRGENIGSYILPASVKVTVEPRQGKLAEYGEDLNLPFMRTGFSATVLAAARVSPSVYGVRTGTSSITFVKTASEGWKIYHYFDKPIE